MKLKVYFVKTSMKSYIKYSYEIKLKEEETIILYQSEFY